ncbi:MAG TPA: hypothetical protein VGC96_05495 [Candidatus Elarobacter sp.]
MLDGRALDVIEEFSLRQHHVNVRHQRLFGLLETIRGAGADVRRGETPVCFGKEELS